MSADLLAEFDSFYTPPTDKKVAAVPASNDLSFLSNPGQSGTPGYAEGTQAPAKASGGDIWGDMSDIQTSAPASDSTAIQEDLWGSWEASASDKPQAPAQVNVTAKKERWLGGLKTPAAQAIAQRGHTRARSSTIDLFANNMQELPSLVETKKPVPGRQPSSGDVLFDADEASAEADDDDEFGEFETVAVPEAPPAQLPSRSLEQIFGTISLTAKPPMEHAGVLVSSNGLPPGGLPYSQAPEKSSFRERDRFGDLPAIATVTKKPSSVKNISAPDSAASPVTPWPEHESPKPHPYLDSPAPNPLDDDQLGKFTDLPADTPAINFPRTAPVIEADVWKWDNANGILSPAKEPAPPVNEAPPTNIPPPSVILALFPHLFDLPQSSLFKAVANQPFSLKNRILSNPATIDFLRAYLLIATVAARIIAGRKLRWKRDTRLSQAMKIGPAAAGGKGGMKLAGVDKTELVREEREAADLVRVWKEHLGRLKSAVAVANTSLKDVKLHLAIPEISEVMLVKCQEGALTAPKCCLICGLRREERVAKVDETVEDSFGEWWVEHWGHRACKNFWQEHEGKLKAG
ncbi:serine/threonine-protein kinase ppk6 [Drepanopeziza brunnea f. sp. 'multigermtubi' MB_m1]|uniref:Serine/threonine-protein kinase ppk6 n=1 Tax=Marssonina brunnea f. sp. multigermtubi (strain MB_m1) TaxID=1072389 RepID=K1Y213_MARBU|nr:serine/threonine-protein kinase ppk6 [Drepanopeziza brunnea f. sp. 'multigermtubi' MB_m1]EKD19139.1 serine/threonine-protein kinase ppk6 [Drepanopeziza brunnea f. sp. 'multigermtubi' MB_m1]